MPHEAAKRTHKACGNPVWWRQKDDGKWEPPYEDKECTIRHVCGEGKNVLKATEVRQERGISSMHDSVQFLSQFKTKHDIKSAFLSKQLNVNDWDGFWSDIQEARQTLKRLLEMM